MSYSYIITPASEPQTIDLPFSFSSNGGVSTVSSRSAFAWRNKILTVLMTDRGSRVWYDKYGAGLGGYSFENIGDLTANLKQIISETFARWLPEITLEEVRYSYTQGSGGPLSVSVLYTLPDNTRDTITLRQSKLSNSGDTLEAVWNG